jgi:uncharacterized protein with FMN-binding domain
MKLPTRSGAFAVSAAALLCASAPANAASLWSMLSGTPDQGTQAAPIAAKKAKPKTVADGQAVPYLDGSYPGRAYDAYYGLVQVQANISGGQLVSIDVLQWPKSRNTSRYINGSALPVLKQEVISAQNTRVDLVSGATLTSEAFLRSLNSALQQASN